MLRDIRFSVLVLFIFYFLIQLHKLLSLIKQNKVVLDFNYFRYQYSSQSRYNSFLWDSATHLITFRLIIVCTNSSSISISLLRQMYKMVWNYLLHLFSLRSVVKFIKFYKWLTFVNNHMTKWNYRPPCHWHISI